MRPAYVPSATSTPPSIRTSLVWPTWLPGRWEPLSPPATPTMSLPYLLGRYCSQPAAPGPSWEMPSTTSEPYVPKQLVPIHELMLSEVGQESMAMFLRPDMLSPVSLTIVTVGDSVTV